MRRLLRDMRFLAAGMAVRKMPAEANRLLEMTDALPGVRQPATIRGFRSEVLFMQEDVRQWPVLHDDLSVVLTQLRALEMGLGG